MTARAAVHYLLSGDAELGLEAVYPANTVDSPLEEFFAVVSWGPATASFGTTGTDRLTIWLHDKQRDYGRINAALERTKQLLTETIHREGEDGATLVLAEWNGESQDLFDSGYNTVTRYTEFTVVSRYASV